MKAETDPQKSFKMKKAKQASKLRRVLLIGLALTALAVLIYGPLYSQYRDLKQRQMDLLTKIREVEKDIAALDHEKYLLEHDLHHLERVVRDELGLARPGEEVYKIKPPEQPAKEAAITP